MSVTISSAGIDTWRPIWTVDPGSIAGHALVSAMPPERGGRLPEPVAGHTVGYLPGPGVLWAEGHPSADGLACAASLGERFGALVDSLHAEGVPLPNGARHVDLFGGRADGFGGFSRTDITASVETESSAEGLAILAGVAAVFRDAPGKGEVWYGRDRGVQTAYLLGHGGRRKLGRFYDEGVAHGTAARGRVVRAEDQRRWERSSRRATEELTATFLRGTFQRRFMPLWRASKGITVAGPIVLAERLREAVEAGDVTQAQAERLAGFLLMQAVRGDRISHSRSTQWRREADCRALGLVLGDGLLQEVEVDLHEVLEQLMETDAWDRVSQG